MIVDTCVQCHFYTYSSGLTGELHAVSTRSLRIRSVTWNRFCILKQFANGFNINSVVLGGLVAWIQICASLNHRKAKKARPWRLILRKLAANLEFFWMNWLLSWLTEHGGHVRFAGVGNHHHRERFKKYRSWAKSGGSFRRVNRKAAKLEDCLTAASEKVVGSISTLRSTYWRRQQLTCYRRREAKHLASQSYRDDSCILDNVIAKQALWLFIIVSLCKPNEDINFKFSYLKLTGSTYSVTRSGQRKIFACSMNLLWVVVSYADRRTRWHVESWLSADLPHEATIGSLK